MKRLLCILLIIALIVTVTGCEKEKEEQSDALKFKEEYESLNGEKNDSGKTIRTISISKDNPIIYSTAEKVSKMIDNGETFVVYFGFAKCPWCRSMIEEMFNAAEDTNIDKIYYVDILDIRDIKEIDDEGNINTTREGDEYYLKLIEQLDSVLSDYTLNNKDEEEINVGEKRIYAPNVIVISKGKAVQLEEGIAEGLEDPYTELTDKQKKSSYKKLKCIFECFNDEKNTCTKTAC